MSNSVKSKFKFWSIEQFLCSHFGCNGCNDQMEKDKIYGTDQLWFENGEKLGEGGFGAVHRCFYHGKDSAYKKVKIIYDKTKTGKVKIKVRNEKTGKEEEKEFENDKKRAIWETTQEYEIQKNVSTKPIKGGKMVDDSMLHRYKDGDECLVLRPFSYFIVEDQSDQSLFMIIVSPKCKSDLNKIKKEGKLDEENTRNIIKQIYRARKYLLDIREIRHQDFKPSNILLDFDEKNGRIENIKEFIYII